MPFLDTEQRSNAPRGTAARLQHSLRQLFTRDWNLKLLALALTLALWYGISGQRQPITKRLNGVQLTFRLPKDIEVSNQPRNEVDLTLTGSKAALGTINSRDLVVYVDVPSGARGEHVEQLTPGRVHVELPEGVKVESVDPGRVALFLEPIVEREVEVEARLGGKLPDGYELVSVAVSPARLTVRGAESHVKALGKIPTEIIPLAGHVTSFTSPQTAVEITDSKVEAVNPAVDVDVEISEKRVERVLTGIRVQAASGRAVEPGKAAATIFGPESKIEKIRAQDLTIIVDVATDGSPTPRLAFPPGMENAIEVRSLTPRNFTLLR